MHHGYARRRPPCAEFAQRALKNQHERRNSYPKGLLLMGFGSLRPDTNDGKLFAFFMRKIFSLPESAI
jgi:hypothetical protein